MSKQLKDNVRRAISGGGGRSKRIMSLEWRIPVSCTRPQLSVFKGFRRRFAPGFLASKVGFIWPGNASRGTLPNPLSRDVKP